MKSLSRMAKASALLILFTAAGLSPVSTSMRANEPAQAGISTRPCMAWAAQECNQSAWHRCTLSGQSPACGDTLALNAFVSPEKIF